MKEPGDTYFECLKCKKKYCLDCQVEWHAGVSCEKYKKWAAENNQADQLFDKYKHNSKGKDCPKCKRYRKDKWMRSYALPLWNRILLFVWNDSRSELSM
jgi:hypothetical protein